MSFDITAARDLTDRWFHARLESGTPLAIELNGACHEIESLRAKLAEVERDCEIRAGEQRILFGQTQDLEARAEAAEARESKLREALEFYAESANYERARETDVEVHPIAVMHDWGRTASEALATKEPK